MQQPRTQVPPERFELLRTLRTPAVYDVTVTTGKALGAGTDSKVFVQLRGTRGGGTETSSGDIELHSHAASCHALDPKAQHLHNKFESGMVDRFRITCEDVGQLQSLSVRIVGSDKWLLSSVMVASTSMPQAFFVAEKWLSASSPSLSLQPHAPPPAPQGACIVDVFTLDEVMAGTDSRIFLIACDASGKQSAEVELSRANLCASTKSSTILARNLFEQNQVDSFDVAFPGISAISSVIVRSDCSGVAHAWLLEKIEITPRGAATLEFCCERWIDQNSPSLQIFAMAFENVFIRDDADHAASSQPTSRSLSLASGPPSRPLPPPPAATFAPPESHFAAMAAAHQAAPLPSSAVQAHQSSPPISSMSSPLPHAAVAAPVPTSEAECRRIYESGDVDALTNLFGRAQIGLLSSTFTIAEEKRVVELLGLPLSKDSKMLEADFVTAIQKYICSHPRPSASSSAGSQGVSSVTAPHSSSAVQAHQSASALVHAPPAAHSTPSYTAPCSTSSAQPFGVAGSGRKDKVYWSSHFDFGGRVNNLAASDYRSYLGSKLGLLRDAAVATHTERKQRMLNRQQNKDSFTGEPFKLKAGGKSLLAEVEHTIECQMMCHAVVYTKGMRDVLRNLDLTAGQGLHRQTNVVQHRLGPLREAQNHDVNFTMVNPDTNKQKGNAATKVLSSMDKKTFQPGDFLTILTDKMHKGLGVDHHASHSLEVAQRCAAAVTRSMRDTLPTLQSTIEEHIGRHQSMVQDAAKLREQVHEVVEELGQIVGAFVD